MKKDTIKKDPGYDVVSNEDAEKIAIEELKRFEKGFGIKIKTFEKEDVPDSLKKIIEQYYTSVLIMIPNTCPSKFPYVEKKSGAAFPLTRTNVYNRCNRLNEELTFLINMHKRYKEVTGERAKSIYLTYIKLLETDALNNIAHMYDVEEETGSKNGRTGINFLDNYSSNEHLTDTQSNERAQTTRLKALNKYIRNSLTHLKEYMGLKANINLNDFSDSFIMGARAELLKQKSDGILELINGNYEVTPALIMDRTTDNGRTKNQDYMLFVGKNGVPVVVNWHLGSSGALSYSGAFSKVPRFDSKKVEYLIDREMPNYETIYRSFMTSYSDRSIDSYKNTSILDKLMACYTLLVRKKKNQDNILLAKELNMKVKEILRKIKLPDELSQQEKDLLSLANVDKVVHLVKEV